MTYPVMEKLLEQSGGSVYKLVILASKRVKELNSGSGKLVKAKLDSKLSVVALNEIERGKVKLKTAK